MSVTFQPIYSLILTLHLPLLHSRMNARFNSFLKQQDASPTTPTYQPVGKSISTGNNVSLHRFLNYHNHKLSTLNAIAWCNSRGQCHFIPRYDYGIWITANRISKCESRNNNHLQNPQKNEWQSESLMEKQIERRRESHTQYHIRMPARSAAASETRDFLLFGCCCCCSVVFRKT